MQQFAQLRTVLSFCWCCRMSPCHVRLKTEKKMQHFLFLSFLQRLCFLSVTTGFYPDNRPYLRNVQTHLRPCCVEWEYQKCGARKPFSICLWELSSWISSSVKSFFVGSCCFLIAVEVRLSIVSDNAMMFLNVPQILQNRRKKSTENWLLRSKDC